MKAKKALKIALLIILIVLFLLGGAVGIFFLTYQSTVSFDCSEKTGAVMKGASGYLYGIAENGVPSAEMVESLDVQTMAQKVPGGLQHPIGDMDNAAPMAENTKYNVVYLQDIYDTWYYNHDAIMQQRADGTYDWQQYLTNFYLPKVETMTTELKAKPYADKLVYCLYNECDNGIWFGESQKDENPDNVYGVWCDYNETGRDNFNAAWQQTYALVKSIHPQALIGGPGFCDYNRDEIAYYLQFCKDNNCLPDVMIYHELGAETAYFFDEHIREYRALEQELGINELPIVITEYGMMSENGYPGEMVKIISQFETNKVYGDNAYWRLADNLNDNCADDNSPNAQWWLMRWYTEMKGQTVKATNKDVLSSNFKNYFKYHLDELSFRDFTGIASVADNGEEIDVVCGGGERKSRIQLTNLDSTLLYGNEVEIRVEETVYKGLYGVVSQPVVRREYTQQLGAALTVELGKLDPANAYHIVIKKADENSDRDYTNRQLPARYEFENGTLLGAAYTYDSYAPASGGTEENHDLVGGMENEGDGVSVDINIPEDGTYQLDFIYGKANDSAWDNNGHQDPNGRIDATVKISIDGADETAALPNTLRSEFTSCYSITKELTKGTHTVTVQHIDGTYVLDSLVVTPQEQLNTIAVLPDEDRTKDGTAAFLAIAPQDGYYDLQVTTAADTVTVDDTPLPLESGWTTLYLKRGLSYLSFNSDKTGLPSLTRNEEAAGEELTAEQAVLTGSALTGTIVVANGDYNTYIGCIDSNGGAAAFTVNAPEAGIYCITLDYSNNEENGVHDYNVDLIEQYVTVDVNGSSLGNVWCRNTYSWQTRKTVTFTAELKEGNNVITFTNDGSERQNYNPTNAPYIFGIRVNPAQQ